MFASFVLPPSHGGVAVGAPPPPQQASSQGQAPPLLPPPPPDPARDEYAAQLYQALASSPLLAPALDARQPTAPVILHPSAPRGAAPRPVTARHLGFLRVDLTGELSGPGRFFPLFPADAQEREVGVDTGSLDRFGCTGHWASSGCIRLLTASTAAPPASGDDGGEDGSTACGVLHLLPPDAFSALWERSGGGEEGEEGSGGEQGGPGSREGSSDASPSSGSGAPTSSGGECGGGGGGAGGTAAAAAAPGGWHVPYPRLFPLEEAYGGLYRELKAAGHDLSRAHYMLRGWKTREGRPRLGDSGPRHHGGAGGAGGGRVRRGVVPAALAATRELRAMLNWPGLLELLEEEGVLSVPTDGVRYWLARLGAGFQAQLAGAGVLCADTSVHHIIARSARGIDHPLNYFLIDKGPNSAMGSKVEGFRDAQGNKLHMRDIVGERAFEVAQAACNLYHGVLYAGRRRGDPLPSTLRELREGAFQAAGEAMAERATREARRAARAGSGVADADAAAGARSTEQQQQAQEEGCEGACADAEHAQQASQQQQRQLQQQEPQQQPEQHQQAAVTGGLGSQPRSGVKRERPPSSQAQEAAAATTVENAAPPNGAVLSPSQQQAGRRRRISHDLPSCPLPAAGPGAAAAAAAAAAAGDGEASAEEEEEVEAGLAAMSLLGSPEGQQQERQQAAAEAVQPAAADLSSLRARLLASLGVTGAG